MSNQFRITSISCANYYSNNNKELSGTVKILHEGTSLEMALKLGPDECTAIYAVIAGRIGEMMQETALNVARDVGVDISNLLAASVDRQQAAIEAAKPEEVEDAETIEPDTPSDTPTSDSIHDNDEIPY